MKDIIFFSNNQNKILEINNLFVRTPYKILTLNNFKKIASPKEIGNSHEENAKIKSLYGLSKLKKICFADDSGISIEALNGQPSVNSKGYLKKYQDENTCLEKIIAIAINKNNFNAYFQTSICLTLSKNENIIFNGKLMGQISKKIRGKNGFGYDPIFVPKGYKQTFSEMNYKEKNKLSHRSIAINKLKTYLDSLF